MSCFWHCPMASISVRGQLRWTGGCIKQLSVSCTVVTNKLPSPPTHHTPNLSVYSKAYVSLTLAPWLSFQAGPLLGHAGLATQEKSNGGTKYRYLKLPQCVADILLVKASHVTHLESKGTSNSITGRGRWIIRNGNAIYQVDP